MANGVFTKLRKGNLDRLSWPEITGVSRRLGRKKVVASGRLLLQLQNELPFLQLQK